MRLRNIPGAKEEMERSIYVVEKPSLCKGSWTKTFDSMYEVRKSHALDGTGKSRPLHIEIGMGKGKFLMEMARRNPDIDYIGLEMFSSVLLRALQKREEAEKNGLTFSNLLFIREDARLLSDFFAGGEVDRIYLNFSDPWPKARHAKRRLTSRTFLSRYESVLIPGGRVEFKTDNRNLALFSLEEAKAAGWTILGFTEDLHHDPAFLEGNVMTEYEEKFSSLGNPIWKIILERRRS